MLKKIKSISIKRAQPPIGINSSRNQQASSATLPDYQELPQSYNTTHLTLMTRDPHWAHAYWEISESSLQEMRRKLGAEFDRSVYVLRVYDVTCINFNGRNANHTIDVEVNPQAKNWYLNFWKDGANYCAEIGMRTPGGQFHSFVRSNFIATPRSTSSNRPDVVWLTVKENENNKPFVLLKKVRSNGRSKRKGLRKFYLNAEDVRNYYSALFPLLGLLRGRRGLKGWRLSAGAGRLSGLSSEELLTRLLGTSAEMVLKKKRGAADTFTAGGASEQLFSGASETISGQKGRKFFFEIWTELLVYGRTEPDAQVKLGEKIVPLRPDGTFSLRYALPDGKIPFDFIATSFDQLEQRRIVTAVERTRTMYSP